MENNKVAFSYLISIGIVNIIIARIPSKIVLKNAKKGDLCRNLHQIQSKSTKMRPMRC